MGNTPLFPDKERMKRRSKSSEKEDAIAEMLVALGAARQASVSAGMLALYSKELRASSDRIREDGPDIRFVLRSIVSGSRRIRLCRRSWLLSRPRSVSKIGSFHAGVA